MQGHLCDSEGLTHMHYGLLTEQSRKARAAKGLYEYLRHKAKGRTLDDSQIAEYLAIGGLAVASGDRFRVLELRLHDEHLSPYFKTDMNLFHLLMLDNAVDMSVWKTPEGTLFLFEGLRESPEPFGSMGHDVR